MCVYCRISFATYLILGYILLLLYYSRIIITKESNHAALTHTFKRKKKIDHVKQLLTMYPSETRGSQF